MCPLPAMINGVHKEKMTLTSLTFEEIDALLALIEFHDDWEFVSERVGTDVNALYEKLSEMRDEV